MSKSSRIDVSNYCVGLVDSFGWFPRCLFGKPPGEWQVVADMCRENRMPEPPKRGPGKDLRVVWLNDPIPEDNPGFVVILFYSPADGWTMLSNYNKAELDAATPGT